VRRATHEFDQAGDRRGRRTADVASNRSFVAPPARQSDFLTSGLPLCPVVPPLRPPIASSLRRHSQSLGPSVSVPHLIHILEVLHIRLAVGGPEHGHEVEAGGTVFGAMLSEVVSCGAFDPTPLDQAGRVLRIGVFVARARLHLDEDNGVVIERDEVDFTERALVIARKDSVPAPAQMMRRDSFAARAQSQVVRRFRRRPAGAGAVPREQLSDEREVHATCASSRPGHGGSTAWPGAPCHDVSSRP